MTKEKISKGTLGSLLGYPIIQDNKVKELRLPKDVIKLLEGLSTMTSADEYGS